MYVLFQGKSISQIDISATLFYCLERVCASRESQTTGQLCRCNLSLTTEDCTAEQYCYQVSGVRTCSDTPKRKPIFFFDFDAGCISV